MNEVCSLQTQSKQTRALPEVSFLGQLPNMLLLLFLVRTSNFLTAGTQTLDLEGKASHIWDCRCHLRHVMLTVGAAGEREWEREREKEVISHGRKRELPIH